MLYKFWALCNTRLQGLKGWCSFFHLELYEALPSAVHWQGTEYSTTVNGSNSDTSFNHQQDQTKLTKANREAVLLARVQNKITYLYVHANSIQKDPAAARTRATHTHTLRDNTVVACVLIWAVS